MTRITLAFLSALAFGGVTLPSHASEGVPSSVPGPTLSGGWADGATGEAGGAFDARLAVPAYGGGHAMTVTGEADGGFARDRAVRLGGRGDAQNPLAGLIAGSQG
jgi:hypothetical protein